MARVLDVVVGRIDLIGARQRVLATDVGATEPPGVHLPRVEPGAAFDDPFRDQAAHAAGAGEAMGAEASRHPEAAYLARPEDELVVGGEGFGAVDKTDHLRVLQCRCAHDGVGHQRLEAIPVRLEEAAVEVARNPVQSPGRGVAFVAAHDQAARLRPVVDEQRGIAHGRHVER